MWASRSARLHPAQGDGPRAVRSDRGQGAPGVAQGPLEQLQRVVVGPADGPGHRFPAPAGTESAGSRAGSPNFSNNPFSKNAVTCRTRSPSRSRTCRWNGLNVAVGVAGGRAHVEREGRLAVGRRRQHHHVVDAAGALDRDQLADVLGADVPVGERRHLPDRLVLEQADDRVDVLAPERLDVLVEQHPLRRRELVGDGVGLGVLVGHHGVGPLERGVDGGGGGVEGLGGLGGRPAQHVAQDQHRALPWSAGAGARRRRRAGWCPSRRRRPRRRAPARATGSRGRSRVRRRRSGPRCRARPAAAGAAGPRGWSGRRWWRCGRARCAPTSGPGRCPPTSRPGSASPGRGPRPRAPTRSSGSSARAARAGSAR